MGADTKISWADDTVNFWIGCTQVSPGCDNCYAMTFQHRFGVEWNAPPIKTKYAAKNVEKLDRRAAREGKKRVVFVNSHSDFFDNQADPKWRDEAWEAMLCAPNLIFLLLTKRPQNIAKMLPPGWGPNGWPNVWLGTSAVNQEEAERNLPHLLSNAAALHWLSAEPLLAAMDLTRIPNLKPETGRTDWGGPVPTYSALSKLLHDHRNVLGWVIAGGESGAGARPCHPDWARALRDQCAAAGVVYHFKQWGEFREFAPGDHPLKAAPWEPTNGDKPVVMIRAGKEAAGRLLDGVEHDGRPQT